jgi:hypothetical protein
VNDAYLIQRYLIEQRIYAEQDVTVLTDELPSGVFYDSGLRTTRVTEDMIVNHLLTLVREEFSTPGDTVFFFYSCHSALRAPGEEPSVILGLGRNGVLHRLRGNKFNLLLLLLLLFIFIILL